MVRRLIAEEDVADAYKTGPKEKNLLGLVNYDAALLTAAVVKLTFRVNNESRQNFIRMSVSVLTLQTGESSGNGFFVTSLAARTTSSSPRATTSSTAKNGATMS